MNMKAGGSKGMDSFRVGSVGIKTTRAKAFRYISDPKNLPERTSAFKQVQDGKPTMATPAGVGLALRMLWHPEDARDAAQEILLRVVTHLATFRGTKPITASVMAKTVSNSFALSRLARAIRIPTLVLA